MNIPESLICPSCENRVKPIRRKAPRTDLENVSPLIEFGWFCPVDACGVRLEKAIASHVEEAAEPQQSAELPDDLPDDIKQHLPANVGKLHSAKVRQIEPKREAEDLFSRIARERNDAIAEETELIDRLEKTRSRRNTLDRLYAAMVDMQPIAAE